MRRWLALVAGVAAIAASTHAFALDAKTLLKLTAPPPAPVRPFTATESPRAVKFARAVVQLKPEPWAVLRTGMRTVNGATYLPTNTLVSWEEGQVETDPSLLSGIVAEELKLAGVPTDGAGESLFAQQTAADLQVGVRIVEMNGRFCDTCQFLASANWTGAVTMTARWEVYSSLERKVVAAVETRGGYTTPKEGLVGEPERLIYEAFRDSARRLIATDEFRRAVTASVGSSPSAPAAPAQQTIALMGAKAAAGVPQASKSVAIVFAADGSGSGFLVSNDGYLLTNHHVVGGSKYVKLKWTDGTETLGEVVRSNPRRDVALIKTDAKGRAPLALRHSAVQQGEAVFAIGTPLDEKLQNTMTKGIVSATRDYEGQSFIQSDVGVTHGNSGGPLLDEKGAVIGLTVIGLYADQSKSLNLFIPIDDALKVLALQPAS